MRKSVKFIKEFTTPLEFIERHGDASAEFQEELAAYRERRELFFTTTTI